jgi:class 3 adenylate cyclase/NO-binding membrane sensor protein with MHYT domain
MHFIGMIAVDVTFKGKKIQMSYNPWISLFSFTICSAACFAGLIVSELHHFSTSFKRLLLPFQDSESVLSKVNLPEPNSFTGCFGLIEILLKHYHERKGTDKPHFVQILVGGVCTATGVVTMHYSGMAAINMEASISYNPFLYVLSVIIALVASVAALLIAFWTQTIWEHLISAIVMAVAVCGMHYTGMAAINYHFNANPPIISVSNLNNFHLTLIVIVGSLVTCMLMVIIVSVQNSHRHEILDRLVESKTKELTEEKNKSENLLLNILPQTIAFRMKNGESNIYEEYSSATILFSDIVGFTELSSILSPKQLVTMLNDLISRFDKLTKKHGIEKIKTIGDAYMAVGGIPDDPNGECAISVMNFAIDMIKEVANFNKTSNIEKNIQIRIGINTGRVVAGVIGSVKFSFDIWGESVNIASRMESSGIPNKIQLSQSTAEIIQNHFELKKRENIEIKSLGNMNTYIYDLNSQK